MSQLTTHILDTSIGKPAAGVEIILFQQSGESWTQLANGFTNKDGRIAHLLKTDMFLNGIFKMRFETKPYFEKQKTESFYPFVEITFEINTTDHYHIPLLLNPFGYTTYRGS